MFVLKGMLTNFLFHCGEKFVSLRFTDHSYKVFLPLLLCIRKCNRYSFSCFFIRNDS